MSESPLGLPPVREDYNSPGFQQYLSGISRKLNKLSQTTIVNSSASVTSADASTIASADAPATTSADATTVAGTATGGGYGFIDATEFNNAITAINSIKTLANELKSDYNATVTLVNEIKSDLNSLVTSLNTLNAALRSAGIVK